MLYYEQAMLRMIPAKSNGSPPCSSPDSIGKIMMLEDIETQYREEKELREQLARDNKMLSKKIKDEKIEKVMWEVYSLFLLGLLIGLLLGDM